MLLLVGGSIRVGLVGSVPVVLRGSVGVQVSMSGSVNVMYSGFVFGLRVGGPSPGLRRWEELEQVLWVS